MIKMMSIKLEANDLGWEVIITISFNNNNNNQNNSPNSYTLSTLPILAITLLSMETISVKTSSPIIGMGKVFVALALPKFLLNHHIC